MAYSKLHSSIVNSSLWTERDSVRILFITMLAACDKEGVVYGSKTGISRLANIDPEDMESAWDALLSPDPESSDAERAPEHEGRRIEKVPGGYRLLNFEYYRGLRNDDDRREQNRAAQARFKAKVSQGKPEESHAQPRSAEESHAQPRSAEESHAQPPKAHAEAETEAEAIPPTGVQGAKAWNPTPIQLRLGSLFRRRPTTPWSKLELKAFKALQVEEEDLQLLETYYSARIPADTDYRRRDLQTLLNNYHGEVDRARNHKPHTYF